MTAKAKPAVSPLRANIGCGAVLALVALGVAVYFSPRGIPESRVLSLCQERAEQLVQEVGFIKAQGFEQSGSTVKFKVVSLPGAGQVSRALVCTVTGDARSPRVRIDDEK